MTCTTHHICDCLKERMEELERKLVVATECIAWYADKSQWDIVAVDNVHLVATNVDLDNGDRARAALEEIK